MSEEAGGDLALLSSPFILHLFSRGSFVIWAFGSFISIPSRLHE